MRTKNCKFHPAEPTKSNTLNLFIAKKYQNENAAHSPLGRAAILSQINVLLCRFSVALVDLSEPDPYDDPHEPRRGNRIDFKQNRGSWDVHAPDPDRSTRDRQKSHSHVHFHADFAPNPRTETEKSSILIKISTDHPKNKPHGPGSDKSTRDRQSIHVQLRSKVPRAVSA